MPVVLTTLSFTQVAVYGFSAKVGLLSFPKGENDLQKPYSDTTAQLIDTEVREMVDRAYARTLELLTEKKAGVRALAEALLAKEVLHQEDLVAILGDRPYKSVEQSNYEKFKFGFEKPAPLPEGPGAPPAGGESGPPKPPQGGPGTLGVPAALEPEAGTGSLGVPAALEPQAGTESLGVPAALEPQAGTESLGAPTPLPGGVETPEAPPSGGDPGPPEPPRGGPGVLGVPTGLEPGPAPLPGGLGTPAR
jgi:hypothetical protein